MCSCALASIIRSVKPAPPPPCREIKRSHANTARRAHTYTPRTHLSVDRDLRHAWQAETATLKHRVTAQYMTKRESFDFDNPARAPAADGTRCVRVRI